MRHYVVSKTPKREEDRLRKSPNGFSATVKLLGSSKTIQAEREKERARPPVLTVYFQGGDIHHGRCGTRIEPMARALFYCVKCKESVEVSAAMEPYILDEGRWLLAKEINHRR